jgi:hypothetical protein
VKSRYHKLSTWHGATIQNVKTIVRLLGVALLLVILSDGASACWQMGEPPTKLRGDAVVGRFTYASKPLRYSKVELRKDGRLLATVRTDGYGYFALSAPKSGLDEVRMLNPSGETFVVDFSRGGHQQSLNVNFYDDYCHEINVQ